MERKASYFTLEVQLEKAESENGDLRAENAELKERVAVLEASQYQRTGTVQVRAVGPLKAGDAVLLSDGWARAAASWDHYASEFAAGLDRERAEPKAAEVIQAEPAAVHRQYVEVLREIGASPRVIEAAESVAPVEESAPPDTRTLEID